VRRVKDGLAASTYKAVDYDQMKSMLAHKRFQGHENLIKVKKLQNVSKLGREQNLLKQHKKAWQREWLRLNALRKKLQVGHQTVVSSCECTFKVGFRDVTISGSFW